MKKKHQFKETLKIENMTKTVLKCEAHGRPLIYCKDCPNGGWGICYDESHGDLKYIRKICKCIKCIDLGITTKRSNARPDIVKKQRKNSKYVVLKRTDLEFEPYFL